MLIQIKKRTGEVIFESDNEFSTIKDTVEEAVRQGISLHKADLRCAYLRCAELYGADLSCADLSGAHLHWANLNNVNLSGADLTRADLSRVDITHADLHGTNLPGTNLSSANISCSNLTGANLLGADLSYTDLCYANLTDAYLCGANIEYCSFDRACFDNTIMPDFSMTCPEKGRFVVYKKIYGTEEYKCQRSFIVKLEIPEDAKRSSATTNKCRCSKAKVLEIKDIDSGETIEEITNTFKKPCVYKVGEYVYPDSFDECRWHECSSGIHFFMTEKEALDY